MAVLNGGYLVRLLFISLLDLFKKGTREMINKFLNWYFDGDAWKYVLGISLGLLFCKFFG